MHQGRKVGLFFSEYWKNTRVVKSPVPLGAYNFFYNKCMILYAFCNSGRISAHMEEFWNRKFLIITEIRKIFEIYGFMSYQHFSQVLLTY